MKYGDSVSSEFRVPSGVPQGSHCGPILFNLFLIDLLQVIKHNRILMYADDVKVFGRMRTVNDCLLLLLDIDRFFAWCEDNSMDVNVSKCNQISFFRSLNPLIFQYSIGYENLKICNEVRDLGILFNTKLSFNSHIQMITSKALKTLGYINRLSRELSVGSFKMLCALVRSILEFGSVVWNPQYEVLIYSLERVQNKFLRSVAFRCGYSREEYTYEELSLVLKSRLNIDSLKNRRTKSDLLFLFRIINGLIDCSDLIELIHFYASVRRDRFTELFKVPFHRTNYGRNGPISRILAEANSFSGLVDFFDVTVNRFKSQLNKMGK